jgi:hypothetical protein
MHDALVWALHFELQERKSLAYGYELLHHHHNQISGHRWS